MNQPVHRGKNKFTGEPISSEGNQPVHRCFVDVKVFNHVGRTPGVCVPGSESVYRTRTLVHSAGTRSDLSHVRDGLYIWRRKGFCSGELRIPYLLFANDVVLLASLRPVYLIWTEKLKCLYYQHIHEKKVNLWRLRTSWVVLDIRPLTDQVTSGGGDPEPLHMAVSWSPSTTVRLLWLTVMTGRSAKEEQS